MFVTFAEEKKINKSSLRSKLKIKIKGEYTIYIYILAVSWRGFVISRTIFQIKIYLARRERLLRLIALFFARSVSLRKRKIHIYIYIYIKGRVLDIPVGREVFHHVTYIIDQQRPTLFHVIPRQKLRLCAGFFLPSPPSLPTSCEDIYVWRQFFPTSLSFKTLQRCKSSGKKKKKKRKIVRIKVSNRSSNSRNKN